MYHFSPSNKLYSRSMIHILAGLWLFPTFYNFLNHGLYLEKNNAFGWPNKSSIFVLSDKDISKVKNLDIL